MIGDTNQKAAGGAVLRTSRRVEEAGRSEGSYQESASNSGPKEERKKPLIGTFTYIYSILTTRNKELAGIIH